MIEQSLIFGPERHLVGTVTLPEQPVVGQVMLLLTNAGVIPRVGPHRVNVKLARHFAQQGIAAMRFDLSGLGDSRRSSSRLPTGEQFVADTRAAMDLAEQRYGCNRFLMIGFCSGADIAHLTALEDPRLRAMVMWDSYVYPNTKAKLLGFAHRIRRHGLAAALFKATRFIGAALQSRKASAQTGGEPEGPVIFGRTRMPPREEFGQRIHSLVKGGVEIYFIYSGGEPDWYNYHDQFHDMFREFGFVDEVAYDYLEQSDHTLTQPKAQAALIEHVQRWFQGRAVKALQRADPGLADGAIAAPALKVA
jgi:dienelactone hydrolase